MPVSWAYINCADAAVSGSDGQIQFAQNVNGKVRHGSSAALRFSTASAAQGGSPDNLLQVTGNVAVSGTLIANAYKVNVHEVNIIHSTGSTRFGDTTDDKHQFSGSVYAIGDISGSAAISGSQLYTTNLVSNRSRVQIPASVSLSFNGVTNTAKITNNGTNLDINSPGNIVLNSGNPNNVTSSGNLVVGGDLSASNCFYVDRETERVGIGTSNPGIGGSGDTKLDVQGHITIGKAGTAYIFNNADPDTYIKFGGSGRPGVDGIAFYAGAKNLLTLDENGRDVVTVGSGSTDTDLDVHGVISASACISGSTFNFETIKASRGRVEIPQGISLSFNGATNTAKITNNGTNLDVNSPGTVVINAGAGILSASATRITASGLNIPGTPDGNAVHAPNGTIFAGSFFDGFATLAAGNLTGVGRVSASAGITGSTMILNTFRTGRDSIRLNASNITYSSSAGGKIYAHDTGSFVGLEDMGSDGYIYALSSDHYGIDISGSNADGVSIYGGFGAEAGVSIISTRHAHFNDPDGDPLILTDESGNRFFYGGTVSGSSHFKIGGNLSASNCFYVDRTRERVGVGTSVPTTPLSVIGVISSSACISGSTLQLEALKTNRLFAQVSSSQAYGGGTTVEGGQYWGGDNRISILRTNTTANGTTMHIGAEAGTRILVSGSTQVQCTSQNVTLSADQKIVMQGRVDCNATVSGSSDLKIGGNLSASNCFYVDRTRERVGVGTSVPTTPLSVIGAVSSSAAISGSTLHLEAMVSRRDSLKVGKGDSTAFTADVGEFNIIRDLSTTAPFSIASYNTDAKGNGEILKWEPAAGGSATTLTAGKLYFLHTDGTWDETDADTAAKGAGQLLGIALGSSARTNGMLVKGLIRVPSTYIQNLSAGSCEGLALFVSTTAASLDFTKPSSSGDFVRRVGYALEDNGSDVLVLFDPANDATVID